MSFVRSLALAALFVSVASTVPAAEPTRPNPRTETVQMWYDSGDGEYCPADGEGNPMPVTGTGETCAAAIADAWDALTTACPDHSSWTIMIRGDCLLPTETATAFGTLTPPPSELNDSEWDAIVVYWCEQDEMALSEDGSAVAMPTAAAAIAAAIEDLKSKYGAGEAQCGEEEPYDPIVKVQELTENPAGSEEWIVRITYEFGNGTTRTRIARGSTYAEADAAAWQAILKLAKDNGGIRSGRSRVWRPRASTLESDTAK